MVHRVEEPRNESLRIRVNPREKQAFERQAQAEGLSVSDWIRTHMLAIAEKRATNKKSK